MTQCVGFCRRRTEIRQRTAVCPYAWTESDIHVSVRLLSCSVLPFYRLHDSLFCTIRLHLPAWSPSGFRLYFLLQRRKDRWRFLLPTHLHQPSLWLHWREAFLQIFPWLRIHIALCCSQNYNAIKRAFLYCCCADVCNSSLGSLTYLFIYYFRQKGSDVFVC